MAHSCRYPSGPAPLSPYVVNTIIEYFGGRPTPPPSPPRPRATVDDYAPCPPSPHCVPSDAEQDQLEWSNTLDARTTTSVHTYYWYTSELDHVTLFADPNEPDDQAHPLANLRPPHPSDRLIYAHESYASPSPVLIMMERATLDTNGLETQPVNPLACTNPLMLFSLTGGRTPLTGLHDHDKQSLLYYDIRPHLSPFRHPECFASYRFTISTVEALQHSLRTVWTSVYPTPIPPVIIRSRDLIGPSALSRRLDGFAFVVPTEDSIWSTIRQRGVDLDFRPMDPSLTVETCMCNKGAAFYFPQHIVASKFAVNVFLETADSATRANPVCEYLGAYVLQAMDGMTINRTVWMDIDPEVQQAVFDRAPDCFTVSKHPSLGWPQLPYVRFCYYKWDSNIVGLADEHPDLNIASQGLSGWEGEEESVDLDYCLDDTDSSVDSQQYCDCDCGVDQDTSAYSTKQKYVPFLDVRPGA
ncbi:hypothetical protein J3R82DRAFT_5279 [Butyriboletus roseoflavus]|nr:hypothetical protein J3R82DRAFT_5279 [Butyriboletus roseoflavus]